MKKINTALFVLATVFGAQAANAQWEYNWLLGVSGGYADRDGDLSLTTFEPAPNFTLNTFTTELEDSGFIGGVLGGYQARCNGWLFGAELAVDWQDTDSDRPFAFTLIDGNGLQTGFAGSAHYDRDALFGLTGRAGYEFSQYIMGYLRAGVEWSRDKLSVSAATANNAVISSIDGSRTVTRFVGGVGIELPVPIMTGLSFRAEYNYHSKGKAVEASGLASDAATLVVADSKPRTNAGKASLVWNFL